MESAIRTRLMSQFHRQRLKDVSNIFQSLSGSVIDFLLRAMLGRWHWKWLLIFRITCDKFINNFNVFCKLFPICKQTTFYKFDVNCKSVADRLCCWLSESRHDVMSCQLRLKHHLEICARKKQPLKHLTKLMLINEEWSVVYIMTLHQQSRG